MNKEDLAPQWPEHEKLEKVSKESQSVGEFLEWLEETKKVFLCKAGRYGDWENFRYSTEKLLAEFFEIDLQKLAKEKSEILSVMRKEDV